MRSHILSSIGVGHYGVRCHHSCFRFFFTIGKGEAVPRLYDQGQQRQRWRGWQVSGQRAPHRPHPGAQEDDGRPAGVRELRRGFSGFEGAFPLMVRIGSVFIGISFVYVLIPLGFSFGLAWFDLFFFVEVFLSRRRCVQGVFVRRMCVIRRFDITLYYAHVRVLVLRSVQTHYGILNL